MTSFVPLRVTRRRTPWLVIVPNRGRPHIDSLGRAQLAHWRARHVGFADVDVPAIPAADLFGADHGRICEIELPLAS